MPAPPATHPTSRLSHLYPLAAPRELTVPAGPAPPDPLGRQLSLPLAELTPLAPASVPPPAAVGAVGAVAVPPQEVWQGLSPNAQARLRQTVVLVLEEVVRNGHDAGA